MKHQPIYAGSSPKTLLAGTECLGFLYEINGPINFKGEANFKQTEVIYRFQMTYSTSVQFRTCESVSPPHARFKYRERYFKNASHLPVALLLFFLQPAHSSAI